MKYNYRIIDYSKIGIPCVEVHGDEFHFQDLYELTGKQQFMTTFNLKKGSESCVKYERSILGTIYYDFKTLKKLDNSCGNHVEVNVAMLKIDSPENNLSLEVRNDLKYEGIKISDIDSISFLQYKKDIEFHDTGEKKVPNIIEIKVDFSDIDQDVFRQNYLISKNNSDVQLILFEKEQLIGITLGINNGRIDSRILKHLGFTENSIKSNLNIWYHLYKVKERRRTLSNKEKEKFSEIQGAKILIIMTEICKEIAASGLNEKSVLESQDSLKIIISSATDFMPAILLHGDKQVYWDIKSYIHITMRHVKEFQIGNFKNKTPFPYKANDLGSLIKKVIQCIEEELRSYLHKNLDADFVRHGRMGVVFNGDHYNLRVDPSGRLTQFHVVADKI